MNCVSVAKLCARSSQLTVCSLHRVGLSAAVHTTLQHCMSARKSPNLACPASHLCGALHRGASCHLSLPSETAHSAHSTAPEGRRCRPGAGFQEAEVLKGEALGGLGVRGHETDAELATAAAVGGGERGQEEEEEEVVVAIVVAWGWGKYR